MKNNKPNLEIEFNVLKRNKSALIAGLDEAGRGPLAGPVVSALVVFNSHDLQNFYRQDKFKYLRENLNDSKKVAEKKRGQLAWQIKKIARYWTISVISHQLIDEINILNATLYSFKKSHQNALKDNQPITNLLIDGNKTVPNLSVKQDAIIDGDAISILISAASILAKTARDELMLDYHYKYPEYGFDRHKGYGTKLHYEMLQCHGPCPIHRKSFNLKLSNTRRNSNR